MTAPTVTVIIPTFDRAHMLGAAIRSVLDQTFRDLELVVDDDGSSAGSRDFALAELPAHQRETRKTRSAASSSGL